MLFFCNPALVNGIFLAANIDPRDYHGEYTSLVSANIDSVSSIYYRGNLDRMVMTVSLALKTFTEFHLHF